MNMLKELANVLVILLIIPLILAIHMEPEEFPLQPDINCKYDGTEGILSYSIKNTLHNPLHLDRAPALQSNTITHLSMLVNGRIVDPDPYCDKHNVEVGDSFTCKIRFDPNEYKTGIFRFFHNIPYLSGHWGRKTSNVLRLRILDEGSKYRENFKFDCQTLTT
ncbi:MAG: hypothetical protein ACE5FT_06545 [Candidatus Nanoarchaeia archaeon]